MLRTALTLIITLTRQVLFLRQDIQHFYQHILSQDHGKLIFQCPEVFDQSKDCFLRSSECEHLRAYYQFVPARRSWCHKSLHLQELWSLVPTSGHLREGHEPWLSTWHSPRGCRLPLLCVCVAKYPAIR